MGPRTIQSVLLLDENSNGKAERDRARASNQLRGTSAKSENGSRWQAEIGVRVWGCELRGAGRGRGLIIPCCVAQGSLGNSGQQPGLMEVPRGEYKHFLLINILIYGSEKL